MDNLQFLNIVFDNTSEGMLLLDNTGCVRQVNNTFKTLTKLTDKSILGRKLEDIFAEQQDKLFFKILFDSLNREKFWQGEFSFVNLAGELQTLITTIINLKTSEDDSRFFVIFKPQLQDDLSVAYAGEAGFDRLTGLPRTSLFVDRIGQALTTSRRENYPLAILMVGLDRFSLINDGLGRESGDILLKTIADRLKQSFRESDTVSRLAGDNFGLLIKVKVDDHSALVAEKILKTISVPTMVKEQQIVITASIGISTSPADGCHPDILMANAESALRHAKRNGGNCYQLFARDLNIRAKIRIELENSLRQALKCDEFVLFYQPKVDIGSSRIVGMEALIRWIHPKKGILLPFKFIPVAEETGLIIDIGGWVLHEACRQNKEWLDRGLNPVQVAVNVSPRQFQSPSFTTDVNRAIAKSGLPPEYLELEITESMLMSNVELTIEKLNSLKKIGLTMAIDDFGTGYSNLSYLTQFPVSTLKIDRTFIKDVENDASTATVTRSIISMSHSLNLKIVAEGAENQEHIVFLKDHNCDIVQGYYYSKPLPAEEFASILEKGFIDPV
ncbi:EAL domain-containing protein [Desulfobacula sp.]